METLLHSLLLLFEVIHIHTKFLPTVTLTACYLTSPHPCDVSDPRDAADAMHGRNGAQFLGNYIRVERSQGAREGGAGVVRKNRFAQTYIANRSRNHVIARSEWRLTVTGIPESGSWQDLKDLMREAGNVQYANVQNGVGVVVL